MPSGFPFGFNVPMTLPSRKDPILTSDAYVETYTKLFRESTIISLGPSYPEVPTEMAGNVVFVARLTGIISCEPFMTVKAS